MSPKNLHFYHRDVYGSNCRYPLEPEFLEAHNLIAGRRTLSEFHIQGYEKLGFKLKEVDDPSPPVKPTKK